MGQKIIIPGTNGFNQTYDPIVVATVTPENDAGKPVATNPFGKIDVTLLPTGLGAETVTVAVSESLAAGDYVNVYKDGAAWKVRKALATSLATKANGFVLAMFLAPTDAVVYLEGLNTLDDPHTDGGPVFLSATMAGKSTATPVSTPANSINQVLGDFVGNGVSFEPNVSWVNA